MLRHLYCLQTEKVLWVNLNSTVTEQIMLSTDTEAEAPLLWPPDRKSRLTGKDPHAGKDRGQEEKGTTEVELVGWHDRLNGHKSEHTEGDSEGEGSLACYSP